MNGPAKMQKKDVTTALLEKFGEDVITTTENFRDEPTFIVETSKIREVCEFLRDEAGLEYKQLSDIAGRDHYPSEDPGRFSLNYHLLSVRWNNRIRLKAFWSDGDDPVPSVSSVWSSAEWEEREAFDMFGFEFEGNPDPRRILMPDDWQGYPQRKDYPLGYETVQFSFNFDEVEKHKPYAKE